MKGERQDAIQIACIHCKEETPYKIVLPTAMQCSHCGLTFDARLGLVKRERNTQRARQTTKRR